MIKQAVIIRFNDLPIVCSSIVSFSSPEEFRKMEKECKDNADKLLQAELGKIAELCDEIEILDKKIALQELEILLLRGKITKEEYESKKKEIE